MSRTRILSLLLAISLLGVLAHLPLPLDKPANPPPSAPIELSCRIGEYDIRVRLKAVDARSGKPVVAAAVWGFWAERSGAGYEELRAAWSLGDPDGFFHDAVTGVDGSADFLVGMSWAVEGRDDPPPLPSGETGVVVVQHEDYEPMVVPWRGGRWAHRPARSRDHKEDATVDLGVIRLERTPRWPDDRPGYVSDRIEMWLEAGATLVWEVDPRTRSVTVHQRGRGAHTLHEADTLTGGPVPSDFDLPLRDLFT